MNESSCCSRSVGAVSNLNLCSGGASLVAQMVKGFACNGGDVGSILGSGRSPGEGNDFSKYSCPENPEDRGAWQATVHVATKTLT